MPPSIGTNSRSIRWAPAIATVTTGVGGDRCAAVRHGDLDPSPANPDDTTRVVLAVPDVPEDYSRTVFVDPYSGEIRGTLTTYGEWLPVRAWFDELHRNLHLGAIGRNYSELAASWLWVVALGGLFLWIGYRRRTGRLRRIAVPDRDATRAGAD